MQLIFVRRLRVLCVVGKFCMKNELIPAVRAVLVCLLKERHVLLEAFHACFTVEVNNERVGEQGMKTVLREFLSETCETVEPLAPSIPRAVVLEGHLRIRYVLAHTR
jgi:hypothetical protein